MIDRLCNLPFRVFASLCTRGLLDLSNDKMSLRWMFRGQMGYNFDIDHPITFNEKLQWLKLYDRKPLYTELVDKHEVRTHIKKLLGEDFLIPELGVWNNPEEIDYDCLPEKFVLKCTHDSGSAIVCRNKESFDKVETQKWLNKRMKRNHYWGGLEWPYKNVKPRINAEMFMSNDGEEGLTDYKFYCFNSVPKFFYISSGLEHHETASISFFDMNGEFMPFRRTDYKGFTEKPKLPSCFDTMKELASKCAKYTQAPFVRVDMYCIQGHPYFSEFTFTPCGGYMPFNPKEYDKIIGDYLKLPIL